MNDTKKHDVTKPKLKIGFGIGLSEYSSAIILGFTTGFVGAIKTIRDRFNDDFNNSSVWRKKTEAHARHLDSQVEIYHNTTVRPSGVEGALIPNPLSKDAEDKITSVAKNREFADGVAKIISEGKNKFRLEKEVWRLHQWGIRDGFVRSTLDMINYMMKPVRTAEGKSKRSGTAKAIIINSTVSAAVGAAMTLSFFNGIATRAKLNDIDNAVEPELEKIEDTQEKISRKDKATASHASKFVREDVVKDERPKHESHVDKLVAEAADQQQVVATAR